MYQIRSVTIMKRLYLIIGMLLFSSIAFCTGRNDGDIIEIKPLRHSTGRLFVTDIWTDVSFKFHPENYSIRSHFLSSDYLENLELSSQFYNIGLKVESYNKNISGFKYNLAVDYSGGRFYDRRYSGSLWSHWLEMEIGMRMNYLSFGANCSTLLGCSSRNGYESGLFRYTYCYNRFVPTGFLALNIEYPRIMLTIKAEFGMHKIDHDKIFALSPNSNRNNLGIALSVRISYKIFSTSRVDNKTEWW